MTHTTVIRYQTHPQSAAENRRLVERVYAELHEVRPAGLRYATYGLEDGVSFIHVAVHEAGPSPLPELAAFQEFQRGVRERAVESPVASSADLIGSYRLLT
jgi:hypothetical protein